MRSDESLVRDTVLQRDAGDQIEFVLWLEPHGSAVTFPRNPHSVAQDSTERQPFSTSEWLKKKMGRMIAEELLSSTNRGTRWKVA